MKLMALAVELRHVSMFGIKKVDDLIASFILGPVARWFLLGIVWVLVQLRWQARCESSSHILDQQFTIG